MDGYNILVNWVNDGYGYKRLRVWKRRVDGRVD